jgi:hypothetical protein
MCREPHFGVETTGERTEQLGEIGLKDTGFGTHTRGSVDTSNGEAEQELEDPRSTSNCLIL